MAVIVPLKAANKGAEAPAELLEGRTSIKGNPQDQSTGRTQGRGTVSQAVERIRQGCEEESEGEIYSVTAPYNARHATLGILLAKGWEGGGGGRSYVGRVRGRVGRAVA